MVSNEILSQAAGAFGFDMHSLEFVSNSTNEVYKYIKGNKSYFLRLSEKPVEYEMMIQSEVHWVRYLAENGVRASLPIQTLEGSLTTSCRDHEKCFIAVVFEGAFGKFFNESPKLWGPHYRCKNLEGACSWTCCDENIIEKLVSVLEERYGS